MTKKIAAASLAALFYAAPASAEMGAAKLKGTAENSPIGGMVTFTDTKDGLKLVAELSGLPPGEHGFHIHEFGSCDDAAKAAGGHFDPEKTNHHGNVMKEGPKKSHAGDMGNIVADKDGKATLTVVLAKEGLSHARYNVGGRAIVVHEKADDFGQPVGNAGGRIACGLISITGK